MAEQEPVTPPWLVWESAAREPIPPTPARGRNRLRTPDVPTQATRRGPAWTALRKAYDAERLRVEEAVGSEEPELVVVIEVAKTVEEFLANVENIRGLEFLFEDADDRSPDDDFHMLKKQRDTGELRRVNSDTMSSTIYFVFTDAEAVADLLRLWDLYQSDKGARLPQPWRKVFNQQVEDVRPWGPRDRLTAALADAVQAAEWARTDRMSIEVELWYRRDRDARTEASQQARAYTTSRGGIVERECVIEGIDYHALLVNLPVSEVRAFFAEDPHGLVAAKQVMYLHRSTQTWVHRHDREGESPQVTVDADPPSGAAQVALLDGLPLANHGLLEGRLIVDDPDERETQYPVMHRRHGTAMASIIVHGDLSAPRDPLGRPLYVRPILEAPDRDDDPERFPTTELLCDVVHRAVVRMREGEGDNPPAAPNVKVVNLSIGDPDRQLARRVSPLARLIDYLADRYGLLFVISAGNHAHDIEYAVRTENLVADLRHAVSEDLLDRRLLSPAEAMNALTVGATNADRSDSVIRAANRVEPAELGSPALYSAVGRGFARSVKPEVFAPGGRQVYAASFDEGQPLRTLRPVHNTTSGPGILVAQPGEAGATSAAEYWRGTSNAAAHVTRFASDVLDRLELLQTDRGADAIPDESLAVLTKALVVHAANWGDREQWEADAGITSGSRRDRMSRLLGYGRVSPAWLFGDSSNQATLIATDLIDADERMRFEIPLPISLRSSTHWRRLRLTLAWMTPINPRHQGYRRAKLALDIPKTSRDFLGVDRAEAHPDTAGRGTVRHEVLWGDDAPVFDDRDRFGAVVSCRAGAGDLSAPARFALVATMEVAAEAGINVRAELRERVALRS